MQLGKPSVLNSVLNFVFKYAIQQNSIDENDQRFLHLSLENFSAIGNSNDRLFFLCHAFSRCLKTEIKIFIAKEAFSRDKPILLMTSQSSNSRKDNQYYAFLLYNETDSNYYPLYSANNDVIKTTFDLTSVYQHYSLETNGIER